MAKEEVHMNFLVETMIIWNIFHTLFVESVDT